MLIDIGDNIAIDRNKIVGLLKIESLKDSEDNKNFINGLISSGKLRNKRSSRSLTYIISYESNKKDSKDLELYVSNISAKQILKRINI